MHEQDKIEKVAKEFGIPEDFMREVSLFPKEELEKTSSYCKIKDWDSNTILEYRTMSGRKGRNRPVRASKRDIKGKKKIFKGFNGVGCVN